MIKKENELLFKHSFLEEIRGTKVSLDIDGVIVNSVNHVVAKFNKEHGTSFLPTDMREYEMVVKWLVKMGFSESYAREKEKEYWYSEFLIGAGLNEGTANFIKILQEANCDIYVISSRPNMLRSSTLTMLTSRLHLPNDKIVLQENNELPGIIFKTMMIQKYGIAYHFEDMHSHAKMILDNTDMTKVVLMSNIHRSSLSGSYYQSRIHQVRGSSTFEPPNFVNVIEHFNLDRK